MVELSVSKLWGAELAKVRAKLLAWGKTMAQGKKLTPTDEARVIRAARTQSVSAIARETGHDRKTVRKILRKNPKSS